jgi:hypothetical protein
MKKTLSESQFQECTKGLDVGAQTLDIAYGVLVQGKTQASFAKQLGLTKGAVSQSVNRVWVAHESKKTLPNGHKLISAVLPEHQAYIVAKWAKEAKKKWR